MLLALRSLWETTSASTSSAQGHQLAAYHLRLQASKWAREKKQRAERLPSKADDPPPPSPLDVLVAGWSVPALTPTIGEGHLVIGAKVSGFQISDFRFQISPGVFHVATDHRSLLTAHSPRLGYGKAVLHRPPAIDPREFTADDLPALALIIAEL